MNLNTIYICIVAIAEIISLVIGYQLQPDRSVPVIAPMLMAITVFLIVMFFIHSINIRNYLYKTHHDTWHRITDYTSMMGNGTYNVPAYYKFLLSDEDSKDAIVRKKKSQIRLLIVLVPITALSIPLNILYVFILN